MDAALAGLLGTSVGAATGLIGGVLTASHQRKAEMQRWKQARADELWKDERGALQALTALLAKGAHEVTFVSWSASNKPVDLVRADARNYDIRIRELLPEIFSAQASASGLSDDAFDEIEPLIRQLLDLDGFAGQAIVGMDSNPDAALRELAACLEPARELERQIVDRVRSVLRVDRDAAAG